MENINDFIKNVQASRKRSGVIYCLGSFDSILNQFNDIIPGIKLLDCANLYKGSITFSASDLLNRIEDESKDRTSIVLNMETFIVSNSADYSKQLAKLLAMREPLNPIYFLFYSKKIYRDFKDQFESKELNRQNTLEI